MTIINIDLLTYIKKGKTESEIKLLHAVPVCNLRGVVVPLVDMNNLLETEENQREEYNEPVYNIAILNSNNIRFGIIIIKI